MGPKSQLVRLALSIVRPRHMLPLLVVVLLSSVAAAQQEAVEPEVLDSMPVYNEEPVPGQSPPSELPYSRIFRDNVSPDEKLFRNVRVGAAQSASMGEADALFEARLFSGSLWSLPLVDQKPQPKDAELKLGPFYLDVRRLSTSVLFSDNINLSEIDRDSGVIGIVRLPTELMLQLGDNLRINMLCTLVWLPFEGEIGVSGFGIQDPLMEFDRRLAEFQLSYTPTVGGWDVEMVEDFRVRHRGFGSDFGIDMFDGVQFDEEDRMGYYAYRDRSPLVEGGQGNQNRDDTLGLDYIETRNLLGASAGRLLPTDTRFEFGGYHANYWYEGDTGGQLPDTRDSFYALLASERESFRFKPYSLYRIYKYDYQDNWDQEINVGFQGPVTENLSFLGQGGYFIPGGRGDGTPLWKVRVRHSFNPFTYHQLLSQRGTTEPDRQIFQTVGYTMSHLFRPDLAGYLYATHSTFEYIPDYVKTAEENRFGVLFAYDLAQHATFRLGGAYTMTSHVNPLYGDVNGFIGRAELSYRFGKTIGASLLYQFHDRDSSLVLDSYTENMLVLTVTAYF